MGCGASHLAKSEPISAELLTKQGFPIVESSAAIAAREGVHRSSPEPQDDNGLPASNGESDAAKERLKADLRKAKQFQKNFIFDSETNNGSLLPRRPQVENPLVKSRIQASDSQIDFFKKLDQKIEQGPDYISTESDHAEVDEKI
ncbi:uncharacterized protein [Oscarella lobularis]|uniref:uncharacterized protein n=1 Tax=Oscarella lobularis TaxID=121494 RepID=UPI003313CBD6